jgi:hypothetical protein
MLVRRPGQVRPLPACPALTQNERVVVPIGPHEPESQRGSIAVENDGVIRREARIP